MGHRPLASMAALAAIVVVALFAQAHIAGQVQSPAATATSAAKALQELGGAKAILATAPSSKAMSALIDGLAPNGRLMVIGVAPEPIEATPVQLITGGHSIQGWASGTPADSEDTLRFSELTGVRPMIETYPLEKVGEAYARMMSGNAKFRVVLTM